jgi:hypothetical protein
MGGGPRHIGFLGHGRTLGNHPCFCPAAAAALGHRHLTLRLGTFTRAVSLTRHGGVEGGGTNPCDAGLDLSGSWQQGHSATYNAPSRI